ncbi:hypothetical protein BO99DRAFT_406835 [Aspergillus violaceofuscus CBS 115571]|uniref:Uncharacterized protein n=1 Tax=Aspergillus violaceofuscus (strain CBS 115571) TaxID=1450538 RepID=A0A2V5GSL3_ASPV1|nr:hypothetical protein BO99DRAFT_406835 [Aspergillus violaceofuscus CBS 115571]
MSIGVCVRAPAPAPVPYYIHYINTSGPLQAPSLPRSVAPGEEEEEEEEEEG